MQDEESQEPRGSVTDADPTQPIVLLVDDDDTIREVLSRVLRSVGFAVIDLSSGAEALRLAEDEQQHFDLLLTDVYMPHMNGAQLGASMQRLRPDIPRIYMSGNLHGITLEDEPTFIAKPCSAFALVELVNAKLQEQRQWED